MPLRTMSFQPSGRCQSSSAGDQSWPFGMPTTSRFFGFVP